MRNSGKPIALIQAYHEPNITLKASKEMDGGLVDKLYLAVGCRVMLRDNLWVRGGLVNGTLGTVHAIVYDTNTAPPSLPLYILVQFDNYQGPYIKEKLFPIITKDVTWHLNNQKFYEGSFHWFWHTPVLYIKRRV